MGDGGARAAGAEEHDAPPRSIGQLLSERHGEARAIGIEAFALAIAEDHGVDSADGARVRGKLVSSGSTACLHGWVMLRPSKPAASAESSAAADRRCCAFRAMSIS